MNILALMPDGYNGFGGIAQYNRDLFDALSDSPQVHSVIAIPRNPAQGSGLPEKLTEKPRPGSKAKYAVEALTAARRLRPDLILCGHMNLLPVAEAAARLVKRPLVLEVYGIDSWTCPGRLVGKAARSVDLVIAISRYTRDRFLSWAPIEPHRVKVVSNAIRLDRYGVGASTGYLAKRYSVQGRRVLLTLGRLSSAERYKGHDRVIKLLPDLLKDHPDLTFLIAGDGDDLQRLKRLAEESRVADHTVFAGRIGDEEKIDHYNLADAFAMPSTGEGFGFVFLEAAACGLPVLGGCTDGSRDALLDGELGVMVDPNNREELLAGLRKILNQPKGVPAAIARFDFLRFKHQVESILQFEFRDGLKFRKEPGLDSRKLDSRNSNVEISSWTN